MSEKKVFSRNEDIDRIAFMNWRFDGDGIVQLMNLGDGFCRSALLLTELCLQENRDKKADIIIFPIFTNFNHGIEVYLKAINWILNKLTNSTRTIEGGHNLRSIYRLIRLKLIAADCRLSGKEFDEALLQLKNYLEELAEKTEATEKDPKMDFSRYPFSNSKENHFYANRYGNIEVDLDQLHHVISESHRTLEQISSYLYFNVLLENV